MKKIKSGFKFIIIFFVVLLVYSAVIEPNLLTIKKYSLDLNGNIKESTDLDNIESGKSNNSIKVIHITDTQIGYFYSNKKLQKMVDKINSLNGDIVVFTGDLIDRSNKNPDIDKITKILSEINPTIGKFAVFGNHDYFNELPKYYRKIMKESGFELLINDSKVINLSREKSINIIGSDEKLHGNFDINKLKSKISKKSFNLLLMHEPDLIDKFDPSTIELTLSGHSHGGQIGIPFKGALIGPPYGRKYTKGFYDIRGNNLYVSSGLGSTRIPFRLFNIPEIVEFDIDMK